MAKLIRQTMLCFGSPNIGAEDCGIFGSLAAGSPTYSISIPVIQSLPAWGSGWAAETISGNRPALEDMNAFCYVTSYGLFYLYEMGIPEYDAGTTYYQNSYCQVAGIFYYSLQDNNIGNAPASSPAYWTAGLKGAAASFPSGGIIMWSGSIASIPAGWYLCDGSNGTPNLSDRFIVAASVDDAGVAKTVMTDGSTKTKSGASNFAAHTHSTVQQAGSGAAGGGDGRILTGGGDNTGSAGSGSVTYPPYYALAFIMKS